jgi:hypothetical protein
VRLWFGNEIEIGLSDITLSDDDFVRGSVPSLSDVYMSAMFLFLFLFVMVRFFKTSHSRDISLNVDSYSSAFRSLQVWTPFSCLSIFKFIASVDGR